MLFLGIDIGTTGTKCLLLNEQGQIISQACQEYGLAFKDGGKVEQDPQDWWDAVKATVRACLEQPELKNEICALAISAQGGSLVVMDQHGQVSGPAITWLDGRGKACRQQLLEERSESYFHERTGMKLENGLAVLTMRWLQENEPERFANASAFYTTLDFVNRKLTGQAVIDPSCAALTQLFNIKAGTWDPEILDLLHLDPAKLARIMPAGSRIGHLTPEAAAELDLPEHVAVVCGGLDQSCMALGIGATEPGHVVLSTGTAWVLLAMTDRPELLPGLDFSLIPHVVGQTWGYLNSISAGASLEWLRQQILNVGSQESYQEMDQQIARRSPGANGLTLYPYFSQYDNRQSKIIGLTVSHDRYDLLRAFMESTGYEIRRMLEALRQDSLESRTLIVTGGASRSRIWMQILSDILNCDIETDMNPNMAGLGAAQLAATGCGRQISTDYRQPGRKYQPNPQEAAFYKRLFAIYLI